MSKVITGPLQELVCTLHAQGISSTYISKELKKQGYTVTQQSIYNFLTSPNNLPAIQDAIQKFRSNPLAVDMAHKRIRLEDLNRERLSLITTLQRMKNEDGSIKEKKIKVYLYILKRLIEVEREGREEMERRPDMVAIFSRTGPLSNYSDEELLREEKIVNDQLTILFRGTQEIAIDAEIVDTPRTEGESKG